jgi:hypothetical protein
VLGIHFDTDVHSVSRQRYTDTKNQSPVWTEASGMSLLVNVYIRDEEGQMVFLDPKDHSEELAGFESYRKTFYGGQAARSLGLRLLPLLAEQDLHVAGDDLTKLENELKLVLENITTFTEQAVASSDDLRFRVQNILRAVQRAREARGSVVIW